MAINALTPALTPVAQVGGVTQNPGGEAGGAFAEVLKNMVTNAVQAQTQASALTAAVATGQDVPMHEVVQAISKAELTLQTLVSVRDKAVEAYQEVARMPI